MGFPRLQVDEVAEGLVAAYCRYELVERRLAELTVVNAAYTVRQFLAWRVQTGRGRIEGLEPAELEEFVVHERGAGQARVAAQQSRLHENLRAVPVRHRGDRA